MTAARSPEHFASAALDDLLAEASQRAEQELERLGPPVATALGLLFGPLAPRRAEDLTRRCVRNSVRNDLLQILRAHGRYPELLARLYCRGAEPLLDLHRAGRGVLVVFIHAGPRSGVSAALSRLGIPSVSLRHGAGGPPLDLPGIELWRAGPDSPERTLFLKRAAARLGDGGCVALAVDGGLGSSHQIHACLGRRVPFARGPLVLQGLTGVPVVPVVVRWAEDGGIDAQFEPPICGSGARLELAQVAAWMEARLREDPAQMRLNRLRDLVALPLAEEPRQAGSVYRISSAGFGGGSG